MSIALYSIYYVVLRGLRCGIGDIFSNTISTDTGCSPETRLVCATADIVSIGRRTVQNIMFCKQTGSSIARRELRHDSSKYGTQLWTGKPLQYSKEDWLRRTGWRDPIALHL